MARPNAYRGFAAYLVSCDVCGMGFQLAARNIREWKRRGREPQSGLTARELLEIAVGLDG